MDENMYLIQYGELALKWKNRRDFEHILQKNIMVKLAKYGNFVVQKKYGKFILEGDEEALYEHRNHIENVLAKTPGIHHFAKVEVSDLDIDAMKKVLDKILLWLEKSQEQLSKIKSFRITTTRTNKNFPMKSMEISQELWAYVYNRYHIAVDLQAPELVFYVNIAEKKAYLYSKKIPGVWGLPVASSGRVVSLLSGWIDSPVASFRMMKRGAEVIMMHAYNKGGDAEQVRANVLKLVEILSGFQHKIQLYLVPYGAIQREIVQGVDDKYRMLLFKRSIVRMANKVAEHVGAKAIVMWDAVGQVASQTLEYSVCIWREYFAYFITTNCLW